MIQKAYQLAEQTLKTPDLNSAQIREIKDLILYLQSFERFILDNPDYARQIPKKTI